MIPLCCPASHRWKTQGMTHSSKRQQEWDNCFQHVIAGGEWGATGIGG